MDTDKQSREFTKEDSYRNLERVMNWISNCDQKMLTLLGVTLVFVILFVSSSLLVEVFTKVPPLDQLLILNVKNGLLLAIATLLVLMMIFVIRGSFILLDGLVLKINQGFESKESFLFFGSMATRTYGHLREQLETISTEDIVEEIDSQTYIQAILCTRKVERLKKGVQAIKMVFGLSLLLVMMLLVFQILY
jgi:hypothetical protein